VKGVAVVWLQCLIGIFIVGIVYTVFTYVLYGNITPALYPSIEAINGTSSMVNTTQMNNTINIINMVWYVWPLMFIFGLIFWAFVASQKREYQTTYQ